MNDLLIARMGAQFGAFTTADAHACGHDSQSLHRLLTSGDIVRVGPRAYVDGRASSRVDVAATACPGGARDRQVL